MQIFGHFAQGFDFGQSNYLGYFFKNIKQFFPNLLFILLPTLQTTKHMINPVKPFKPSPSIWEQCVSQEENEMLRTLPQTPVLMIPDEDPPLSKRTTSGVGFLDKQCPNALWPIIQNIWSLALMLQLNKLECLSLASLSSLVSRNPLPC